MPNDSDNQPHFIASLGKGIYILSLLTGLITTVIGITVTSAPQYADHDRHARTMVYLVCIVCFVIGFVLWGLGKDLKRPKS